MRFLCITSLLTLSTAIAQESLVWSEETLHSATPTVFPAALEPLNDGGSMWVGGISGAVHSGARPMSWRFARRDASGTTMWEDTLPLAAHAFQGGFFSTPGFCADADGSGASAVAVQRSDECHVVRYSAAGARSATSVLTPSNPNLLIEPMRIDVDSQLRVRVCAFESSLFAHSNDHRASVTQLDALGQVAWRVEVPGQDVAFAELPGGELVVAASHPFSTRFVDIVRVSPSGTVGAPTTVDLGQSALLRRLYADPITGGTWLVGSASSAGMLMAGLHPNDTLAWTTLYPGLLEPNAVAFDATSGRTFVAAIASFSTSPNLVALDGNGALVFERAVGNHGSYQVLAPREGGGVLGVNSGFSNTFVGSLFLHEVDATGADLGSQVLDERQNQRVTSFGRSIALHSEGGRTLVAAGFRNYNIVADGVTRFHRLLHGTVGTPYCPQPPNSTGTPSELRGAGSPVLGEARFALVASELPPGSLGMFIVSQAQASVAMPGGSAGTLCLGGAIGRFAGAGQVRTAGPDGSLSLEWDPNSLPQPTGFETTLAGQTWSFQGWHRDVVATTTSSFTNGLEVQLQ